MKLKNPCGLPLITQCQASYWAKGRRQRDFLENVCETSTLSQPSLLHPESDEVASNLNSILFTLYFVVWNDVFLWYSKKRPVLCGIDEVASLLLLLSLSLAFTLLTKIKRYMVFCWPAVLFNLGEIQNGTRSRAEQILSYMKRYEPT